MPAAASAASAVPVTSVSATALSDHLPTTVPRLDPSGLNWAIFSIRFQDAVEAKGFWGHFDGTTVKLVPANAQNQTDEEKEAIASNANSFKKDGSGTMASGRESIHGKRHLCTN